MGKRFKVKIANIPEVFNDQLGPEQRAWLKLQHPADYAYLLHLEKESEAADEPKVVEGSNEKPSNEKKGG